jgi:hypothetical protein
MKHYKITVNSDFTEIYPYGNANSSDDVLDMLLENLDDFSLWKKYFPSQSWILRGLPLFLW